MPYHLYLGRELADEEPREHLVRHAQRRREARRDAVPVEREREQVGDDRDVDLRLPSSSSRIRSRRNQVSLAASVDRREGPGPAVVRPSPRRTSRRESGHRVSAFPSNEKSERVSRCFAVTRNHRRRRTDLPRCDSSDATDARSAAPRPLRCASPRNGHVASTQSLPRRAAWREMATFVHTGCPVSNDVDAGGHVKTAHVASLACLSSNGRRAASGRSSRSVPLSSAVASAVAVATTAGVFAVAVVVVLIVVVVMSVAGGGGSTSTAKGVPRSQLSSLPSWSCATS